MFRNVREHPWIVNAKNNGANGSEGFSYNDLRCRKCSLSEIIPRCKTLGDVRSVALFSVFLVSMTGPFPDCSWDHHHASIAHAALGYNVVSKVLNVAA